VSEVRAWRAYVERSVCVHVHELMNRCDSCTEMRGTKMQIIY
jgi:hypothetical protein